MGLLERAGALRSLAGWLDEVEAGEGRMVFVGGEAGIGKTTLARAFEATVSRPVAWGFCVPLSAPQPLRPIRDVAPAIGGDLIPALAAGRVLDDVLDRVRERLAGWSGILVIEDIHWADEATLDLLRWLGPRTGSLTALLIVTYRDDELAVTHPLRRLLGDLAGAPAVRRITLAPLSKRAVRQLALRAGRDGDEVYRATNGNPFFVTEVLATPGGTVPPSVRDAVLARAGRLSPQARGALDAAAVIGPAIDPRVLATVTDATPAAVEECVDAGVLVSRTDMLAFRHEIARQGVAAMISAPRRLVLHARTLAALEEVGERDPAVLAHHAEAAREWSRAAGYGLRAADEALALGAQREGAAQLARVLRCTPPDDPSRAKLLERYGLAAQFAGQTDEALRALRQVVALRAGEANRHAHGEALCRLTRAAHSADRYGEADAASTAAVATLEPLGPSPPLALACALRAGLLAWGGRQREALSWAERARELGERFDHEEAILFALNIAAVIQVARGDAHGYTLLDENLDRARQAGIFEAMIRAHVNRCAAAVTSRDLGRAQAYLRDAAAFVDQSDAPHPNVVLAYYEARVALDRGELERAQTLADAAAGEITQMRTAALTVAGLSRARRGAAGAWEALDAALERVSGDGGLRGVTPVRAARAEARWLDGDLAAGRDEARLGLDEITSEQLPWAAGELALWLSRCGGPPAGVDVALPFALELDGDWRRAQAAWRTRGVPYEAALSTLAGDAGSAREALGHLQRIGASAAAAAYARHRRAHGLVVPRGMRPATQADPFGLTPRQRAVLELVAEGLRNAEIAERLVVSERTVEHHVTATLRKLGVGSRAEAVARAVAPK